MIRESASNPYVQPHSAFFSIWSKTSALFGPSILRPALLFGLGVPIDSITSPNSRHCLFKMTSFRCLEASQVRAPSMVWLSHRCPESQHKNLNLLCDLTGCLGQMISKPSSSGRLTEKDNCLVLALLGDRFFFSEDNYITLSSHKEKQNIRCGNSCSLKTEAARLLGVWGQPRLYHEL